MNVDIVGRIRPAIRADGAGNLVIEGHRVAAKPGGPYVNLQYLHKRDASVHDIFKHSIQGLLDSFMAGFNACLLVMGESESGKSYTTSGENVSKSGIIPMLFDYLFTRLKEDKYMFDTKIRRENPLVTLQMYEIYNELIKDLLQQPGAGSSYLDLSESPDKGIFIKNSNVIAVKEAAMAHTHYRQGLARRTEATTDFGPAQRNAALLVHIDLEMVVGENSHPNKCRFTIVELPGLEKLAEDPTDLRQREGPALSKSLLGLKQLVTALSSNPYADRVISYSESKLTQLLRDELGGNCMTKAVLCLKPHSNPNTLGPVFTFATRVSQVKNFPVINDSFAQNLLTQYRAKIIDLQQQSGVGPVSMSKVSNVNDVKETVHRLETENLRLRDDNESLRNRMDGMKNKFGNLVDTRTDLSHQLLMTEEEKLKVSQSLVEMQIENNKIREEAEATKFELTNKILMLEDSLMNAETQREWQHKSTRNAKERLSELERDRKDLADEYVVLKTNYLALVREQEKDVTRNEELSIELLNLVNAKATLMQQIFVLTEGDKFHGDPQAEVDRVKALVDKNSSGKIKADEILGTQKDREAVEKTLFASKKRFEGDIEKMKREHNEEQQKLDSKVQLMQKENQDYRNLIRERQHKVAELNAQLIIMRGDKEQLEVQVNRLQHKVKDIGEDYRARLIKYVEDIAKFMDEGSGVPEPHGIRDRKMREYVDRMIISTAKSHKEREEQLSYAAQQYREGKRIMANKYEALLVSYRNLRQLCEQRGFEETDMGPDEHEVIMSDTDIQAAHHRENNRLKAEINKLKKDLDGIRAKVGLYGEKSSELLKLRPGERPAETWAALRKQLREYTLNTQRQLEDERARLLSENEVVKEQLKESQDYIDSHLIRYKQEIVKLRRMLGYDEDALLLGGSTDRSMRGRHRRH